MTVMTLEDISVLPKQVIFKSFKNLMQIEKALRSVQGYDDSLIQASVLGKFPKFISDDITRLEGNNKNMQHYWKKLLGVDIKYGKFKNPEIGTVFVVGPLASIFLNKINGKNLGNMSTGIYGILRGLGANKYQAETYLHALNNNEFLLILRGNDTNAFGLDNNF